MGYFCELASFIAALLYRLKIYRKTSEIDLMSEAHIIVIFADLFYSGGFFAEALREF